MNHAQVLENVLPPKAVLKKWALTVVEEDIPSFDIGAAIVASDEKQTATLYCKSANVVLAGRPFVNALMEIFNCEIEWMSSAKEGEWLNRNTGSAAVRLAIATVKGTSHDLLQVERLALNVLTRCSSIATESRSMKEFVRERGYNNEIAATRKTTPLFRLVEKYGVIVGGCSPHRYDVSQMCMLKDNHIDLFKKKLNTTNQSEAITAAVKSARQLGGFSLMIEVECRSLQDAKDAAKAGANIVMLDNFSADQVKEEARLLKDEYPNVTVEVSGGLRRDNITAYLTNSVDVFSMGSLIEGVPTVDFSMKINS